MAGILAAGCATSSTHSARFEYARILMGVEARIVLYAPDENTAIAAGRAAFERIDALDRELSDYKPESELSQLGDRGGGEPVEVGADLYRVLEASIAMSRASDGAFDATVGPLVALWRRARRTHELPTETEIAAARALVGWRSLELDPERHTARLAKEGMRLDIGGIGKGFACDEALAVLRAHKIERCLVALAGDIRVGAPPPGRKGWNVEATAGDAGSDLEELVLSDCGVSTSGDTEQFVEIGGARWSHIVDPRTGRALTSRLRVTVIAADATSADALATAASVLGPTAGIALVARHADAGVMFEERTPNGVARTRTSRFDAHH
jgi:thiamine biosynthesis lipoprotein